MLGKSKMVKRLFQEVSEVSCESPNAKFDGTIVYFQWQSSC